MKNNKEKYVGVNQVMSEWGVSRAKAYTIIQDLNKALQDQNPHALIVHGRVNRAWYEEACSTRGRKE